MPVPAAGAGGKDIFCIPEAATPVNIEIKARASDWDAQRRLAAGLSGPAEELLQEDTFFNCPEGRLKLREQGEKGSYLIFYRRGDIKGPKSSEYSFSPVPDPASLKKVLAAAFGEKKTVKKRRTLFLCGRTRIHFDEVEGLGRFIELEVCLAEGEDPEAGRAEAEGLMRRLGIAEGDLLEGAYGDML